MARLSEVQDAAGDDVESDNDLTIDDLARDTGLSVRNVRSHQARGLLPPPEVRGRVVDHVVGVGPAVEQIDLEQQQIEDRQRHHRQPAKHSVEPQLQPGRARDA